MKSRSNTHDDRPHNWTQISWPKYRVGFNYCLTVVAKDSAALKTYLHSQPHADWVPVVRPHFGTDAPFTLVFDTPLTIAVAL